MNTRTRIHGLVGAAATGLWATIAAATAEPATKMVSVCSSYGNGCTTGPVRRGKWGPEVRLKSGTWIDCKADCAETLRDEVLDFWERQSEKAMAIAPGGR